MVRPSDQPEGPGADWAALQTRSASVASVVVARLEELIRRGDLADGSQLPAERQLAQMLNVSRASVREAVRELWLKGLVDRQQGRGTFVTAGAPMQDAFQAHIHERLGQDDLTVLRVMDFRASLEPAIARRAAQRATFQDLEEMARILGEMEREASAKRSAELDAAFHRAVAVAAQNPLLVEVVEFSGQWLRVTRKDALQGRRRRDMSLRSHRAVLHAISERDPEAAAAAMSQHVREVSAFVEHRLEGASSQGGTRAPQPTFSHAKPARAGAIVHEPPEVAR